MATASASPCRLARVLWPRHGSNLRCRFLPYYPGLSPLADEVLSTGGICRFTDRTEAEEVIVGTGKSDSLIPPFSRGSFTVSTTA